MSAVSIEHQATVWLVDDIPVRMLYAGQRWRITDTPTRLRESVWTAPLEKQTGLYGWRFQATSEAGDSYVFDVYRAETDWHVHHRYA